MDLMVRKSGQVILKMSELEAVTLQDVMTTVKAASVENAEVFNRTQKAVIGDLKKTIDTLDAEIANAEKRSGDNEEEAAPTYPAVEGTAVAGTGAKKTVAAKDTATA